MVNISLDQKLDNIRNIRGFIHDIRTQQKRTPSTSEIAQKLEMNERTVRNYKKQILIEDRQILYGRFEYELVAEVNELLETFEENKIELKNLRSSERPEIKLDAMKQLVDTHVDKIRVLRDGPQYINNEQQGKPVIEDTKSEYLYGPEDQFRAESGFRDMFG